MPCGTLFTGANRDESGRPTSPVTVSVIGYPRQSKLTAYRQTGNIRTQETVIMLPSSWATKVRIALTRNHLLESCQTGTVPAAGSGQRRQLSTMVASSMTRAGQPLNPMIVSEQDGCLPRLIEGSLGRAPYPTSAVVRWLASERGALQC